MNDLDTNPLRGELEVGMRIRIWVKIDAAFFMAQCCNYDVIDKRYEFAFLDGTGQGVHWLAKDIKKHVHAGTAVIVQRPGYGAMPPGNVPLGDE